MTELLSDEELLDELQRSAFGYFTHTVNPENGLIPDSTRPGSPSSIAAVGLALAAYPVGVKRGYISREEAAQLTLTTLRFFWNSPQGPAPEANGEASLTHGWQPESGFLGARWKGYNEGLFLYILGLGSPTHPLSPEAYQEWASTYAWKTVYGIEYLYAGPLFIHQYSHLWLDLRGIQDDLMREKGCDYYETCSI